MEGTIFAVRKPAGISSFGVVRQIRKASGVQRIGHAGTLDPFAEGVLVIGMGREATKHLGDEMRGEKEYIADISLGTSTDTGDPTGKVVDEKPVPILSLDVVKDVLKRFLGASQQIPPAYSALKVDGKRLYKLARQGIEVERKSRPIIIREIELLEVSEQSLRIRVICGHGTYIRTLAEDIGLALGTVAHLVKLVRTRVGDHSFSDAFELESLVSDLNLERSEA